MIARYSVIIPTLNEEKFLPKLLTSLAAQTDKNFEVIVVDGSSKDRTVTVAKSYAKQLPKLTILVSREASLPLQRNMGARKASGEWFIFIDADSIVSYNFIERVEAYLRKEKLALFTTWTKPDSDDPRDANIASLANLTQGISLTMHRPLASGPLTAVTRKAFERVGGYNESHSFNEDVDFCLRVQKAHFPVGVIPETLYTWSLRRFRHQGTIKVFQQYVVSALPILIFNRPLKKLSGYVMGGQLYNSKKKKIPSTTLRRYEKRLRKLLKDLFE